MVYIGGDDVSGGKGRKMASWLPIAHIVGIFPVG